MNEFLRGPVWTCEEETGIAAEDLPLVHEDSTVASLNREIGELYDSYYEFDSHDQACWFNEKQEKADKPLMLELLGRLNARIAELNDGSFVVDDQETPRVEALYPANRSTVDKARVPSGARACSAQSFRAHRRALAMVL